MNRFNPPFLLIVFLLFVCAFSANAQEGCACPHSQAQFAGDALGVPNSSDIPPLVVPPDEPSCLTVQGTLTIDQNFDMINRLVFLQPGAEIVVNESVLLTIEGSILQGCEEMWQSITLRPGALLDIQNSTVRDAEFAVHANHNSVLRMRDNVFTSNHVSLYANGGGLDNPIYIQHFGGNYGKEITGNQFTGGDLLAPREGQLPEAGILFRNVSFFALGDDIPGSDGLENNVFSETRHGVALFDCEFIGMHHQNFRDLLKGDEPPYTGSGVISWGTYNNKVKYCTFDNVFVGVGVKDDERVDVNSCTFTEVEIGIGYNNVTGACSAFSNTIEGCSTGFAWVGDAEDAVVDASNNIIKNSISAMSISARQGSLKMIGNIASYTNSGISIRNFDGTGSVLYNDLTHLPTSGQFTGAGILTANSSNCEIVGNSIIGASSSQTAFGIHSSQSKKMLYCSNAVGASLYGFVIGGIANNTDIRCTTFDEHFVGLNYRGMGLPSQDNHGNNWSSASCSYADAYSIGGPFELQMSPFKVASTLLPNGYTKIVTPNASPADWFTFAGSAGACGEDKDDDGNVVYCGKSALQQLSDDTPPGELAPEDHTVLQSPAAGQSNVNYWESHQYVYGKLNAHPELLDAHPEFDEFYQAFSGDERGAFFTVRQRIHNLSGYDDGSLAAQHTAATELNSLGEELTEELETYGPQSDAAAQQKVAKLLADSRQAIISYRQLKADYRPNLLAEIDKILAANATLPTSTIFQSNEVAVHDIYLRRLASEDGTLTLQEQEVINDIADQCPQIGGTAVYLARGLQLLYAPASVHSDLDCNTSVQGLSMASATGNSTDLGYPNPADQVFYLNLPYTEVATQLTVLDATGRAVRHTTVPPATTSFRIDVAALPSGLYFVRASTTTGTPRTQRVLVQH